MGSIVRFRLLQPTTPWIAAIVAMYAFAMFTTVILPFARIFALVLEVPMLSAVGIPLLVGAGGWLFTGLLTVALRLASARSRADLEVDVRARRITVDGVLHDLSHAVSVDVVQHAVLSRSRVVVRDMAGRRVWQLSHLPHTHARCLAIDLSTMLGLFAPATLGRIPDAKADGVVPAAFRTGVHRVDVTVWSSPLGKTQLTFAAALAPAFMTFCNPASGMTTLPGGLLLVATAATNLVLLDLLPVRVQLGISADTLVVRRGTLWVRQKQIPILELHPPRIVADGADRAALFLRSRSGLQIEIRGRPRAELEQIAWWIEHARTRAVPALPEPVPDLPEALEALRRRARDPIGR